MSKEIRVVSATRALDLAREMEGDTELIAFGAGVAVATKRFVRIKLGADEVIIRPPAGADDLKRLPELETWGSPPPLE